MLQLRNIRRNDNTIQANYYPEDREECGFVAVDCKTGDIINSTITPSDGELGMYCYHAAYALERLAKQENFPETQRVLWY